MRRIYLVLLAAVTFGATVAVMPAATAQAPIVCKRTAYLVLATYAYTDVSQLRTNGCWFHSRPVNKQLVGCHGARSGFPMWAYDDTNWSHPNDDAIIKACAGSPANRNNWGAAYMDWSPEKGTFKEAGKGYVGAFFAEIYTDNTYLAEKIPLDVYRAQRKKSATLMAPMVNIGARNFKPNSADQRMLLLQLCREQGRTALLGVYAGSRGDWKGSAAGHRALNAVMNACTDGTLG